jgi:hypothetical protein
VKIAIAATVAVVLLSLTACGMPVREEKLTGNYVLMATDLPEDLHICYLDDDTCYGGIDSTIARVGWDEKYIVALQHPSNDRSISNYYYIDLSVKDSAWYGVKGPFSLQDHLPDLSYRITESYVLDR